MHQESGKASNYPNARSTKRQPARSRHHRRAGGRAETPPPEGRVPRGAATKGGFTPAPKPEGDRRSASARPPRARYHTDAAARAREEVSTRLRGQKGGRGLSQGAQVAPPARAEESERRPQREGREDIGEGREVARSIARVGLNRCKYVV